MADLDFRSMMTLGGVVVAAGGIALSVRLMAKRNQERKEKERQRKITDGDKLAAARYALDAGNFEAAAVSFLAGDRPRDAARAFAKAEMWERAALVYEQLGDWKLAGDHYAKSGDRAAQIRVLRRGGLLVEAAKVAAEDGEPGKAAQLMLKAGRRREAAQLMLKAGQEREARELAAELLEEEGNYEDAARNWSKIERYDRAADCLKQAGHWDLAAKAMLKAGKRKEAGELLAIHGHHAAAAQIFESLQDFRRAAKLYGTAGNQEASARCLFLSGDKRAVIELRIAHGDLDDALRLSESIGAAEPGFVEALQIAAGLYESQGDLEGTLRLQRRLLAVDLPAATRRRLTHRGAEIALELGKRSVGIELARAQLGALPADDPDHAAALELVARLEALPVDVAEPVAEAASYTGFDEDRPTNDELFESARAAIEEATRQLDGQPMMAQAMRAPEGWPQGVPPSLAARYDGLRLLGRGGNGVVFRAHDTSLGRDVALKFMIEGVMPDELARRYFLREIKIAAGLDHANIVRIYDSGLADGVLFYSMEYLDGRPLGDLVPEGTPFPDRTLLRDVFLQVCDALGYAHERGLVHRDIKPDNIYITGRGEVKLLDFGLARAFDDGFGEQSVLAGTPYYMAPEQIGNTQVDHRVDVYALGVILYRCITGLLPFTEGNVFIAHAMSPIPDPRATGRDVSDALAEVVFRAMAKKAEDRYQTCAELREAIAQALAGGVG